MPGGADVVPVVVYRLVADTVGYRRSLIDAGQLIVGLRNTWVDSVRDMAAASRAAGFGSGPGILAGLGLGAGVAAVGVGVLGAALTAHAVGHVLDVSETLVSNAVRLGVEYQKSAVSFNVLTGSMELGKRTLEDIYQLSTTNPFTFRQMSHASQMLMALGVPADNDNMITVLSRLSDLATGDERKLQRLALAYGQVMSAGRLRGEELRQFTNVGVGVGDFAKAYGKLPAEFRADLEAGLVPASVVTKTLNQLTNIGGRFADLNAQVNKTVGGQWNQMTERAELFLAKLGVGFFERFDVAGKIGFLSDMLKDLQNLTDDLLNRLDRSGLISQVWNDVATAIKTVRETQLTLNTDADQLLQTYRSIRDVVVDIAQALALAGTYAAQGMRHLVDLAVEMYLLKRSPLVEFMTSNPSDVLMGKAKAGVTPSEARLEIQSLIDLQKSLATSKDFTQSRTEITSFFDRFRTNLAAGNRELTEQEKKVQALAGAYTYLGRLAPDTAPGNLLEPMLAGGLGGGAGVAGLFRTNADELAGIYKDFVDKVTNQDTVSAARQNARGAFAGVAADLGMMVGLELNRELGKPRKLAPVKFEISSDATKAAMDLGKHIADHGFGPLDRFEIQMSRFREARFGPGNADNGRFNFGLGAMGGVGAMGANLTLQAMSDKNFKFGSYEEFEKLRKAVAVLEPRGTPAMAVGSVEGQDAINRALDQTQGIEMEMLRVLTLANTQRQQLIEEIRQYNAALGYDTGGF